METKFREIKNKDEEYNAKKLYQVLIEEKKKYLRIMK